MEQAEFVRWAIYGIFGLAVYLLKRAMDAQEASIKNAHDKIALADAKTERVRDDLVKIQLGHVDKVQFAEFSKRMETQFNRILDKLDKLEGIK